MTTEASAIVEKAFEGLNPTLAVGGQGIIIQQVDMDDQLYLIEINVAVSDAIGTMVSVYITLPNNMEVPGDFYVGIELTSDQGIQSLLKRATERKLQFMLSMPQKAILQLVLRKAPVFITD